MANFLPFDRDQPFLLPPDLKAWIPDDDLAHFVIPSVERVSLHSFAILRRAGGKPQYNPRLMLALLIDCYANGLFSSRRIERATYRDIAVHFIAANQHPEHDTIATVPPQHLRSAGPAARGTRRPGRKTDRVPDGPGL